jgi:hypothetical protein
MGAVILYGVLCFLSTDGASQHCSIRAVQSFPTMQGCEAAGPVIIRSYADIQRIKPVRQWSKCVAEGVDA